MTWNDSPSGTRPRCGTRANDDLYRAQEAMARNDSNSAKVILTRRNTILLGRKKPRAWRALTERTKQMLAEVEKALEAERASRPRNRRSEEVQARYRRFLDRRKEAPVRDTQFPDLLPGLLPSTNFELTRKAAEGALSVFAEPGTRG